MGEDSPLKFHCLETLLWVWGLISLAPEFGSAQPSFRVSNHPGVPRTILVLALKVPCPGNSSLLGRLGQLVTVRASLFLSNNVTMKINSHHPTPNPLQSLIIGKVRFQDLSMCCSSSQEKINPQQLLFYRKRFTDFNMPAKKKKIFSAWVLCQLDRQWQRWVVSNGVFHPWAGFEPHSSATWRHPGLQTLAGMPQSVTIRAAMNFPVLTTRQDVFWRVFSTWMVCFQERWTPE